ncbi:DUF2218 domain-containing protein [Telmatospirillum sp. J64-1]|uniref:DUF2218 domain-containing protein n=1 Tax=Telmatospirillum sp. J64-1 TaxID=2502183 RepID=UPI00115DEAFB|nr:DUF2218 domain-containing protein [Telmatospirillum sp. J64-1]
MDRFHAYSDVSTDTPSKYISQLCKHFAHKLTVSHDDSKGRIEFPIGLCLLESRPDVLHMEVEAASEEDLTRLQEVVASHLERFAWRSPPQIHWQRSTDKDAGQGA